MTPVKVWQERVEIPTYETGPQDIHPMFLENRVYQGSSGAVYPYGVTDTLSEQKTLKSWQAVWLENDYIKVMILPELGGRVHRAWDKVKQRDFVYHNEVIKPALVGLLGPWISGGIEFNWPQHHRPTTFMPVDFTLEAHEDGAQTVWVGETEPMHGLQVMTGFTLRPDRAALEIASRVYNGNATPRHFLWWANPAVKGGEGHQSVFPPDVTAVFDHGKRAVSAFPIATGTYYKVDYSAGVDISRYKNVPVPTSYMAEKSQYDFVGAWCHDEDGGLLHVANHHIAPGKKQWSWGHSEFGQAWDKSLTDNNGPYIELMTGIFADNQPDFTWLDAYEEKRFEQYFLPYHSLGMVQNASRDAVIKLQRSKRGIEWGLYAISPLNGYRLAIREIGKCNALLDDAVALMPATAIQGVLHGINPERLTIELSDADGWRGLAIHAWNKQHDYELAARYLDNAYQLAPQDARLLFERDLLDKLSGATPEKRLARLENNLEIALKRDDMTAELLNLWHLTGQADKAADILATRKFHPWEGGEGKVTSQFILNQLLRAWQHLDAREPQQASELLHAALHYPENLSEGRLPGQTDNDIWFWQAICANAQGDETEAMRCLRLAATGDRTINIHSYYNDQPVDYLFWQGMALRLLGEQQTAQQLFSEMKQWAQEMAKTSIEADFFAVSQPDLLSLYGDLQQQHKEKCLMVAMLASAGLGEVAQYESARAELTAINPAWPKAALFTTVMPFIFNYVH
ncbi:TPA: DUF5107 domain-containing protein [Escherichia coli]